MRRVGAKETPRSARISRASGPVPAACPLGLTRLPLTHIKFVTKARAHFCRELRAGRKPRRRGQGGERLEPDPPSRAGRTRPCLMWKLPSIIATR